ncbi:uncharacterized protein LODBEIA_P43060 [Lodderomyces beijingensis]|uniref:Nuclear fusion protein KAR5 n=1 Tax=Lodderomyces beijingensis TaxID=1775926 RepID=A0ABP0ZUV3_9ASCO
MYLVVLVPLWTVLSRMTIATELSPFGAEVFPNLANWIGDCNQRALEPMATICAQGLENLSLSDQKRVALELSICEFENNGIEYPLECHVDIRQANIGGCIQSLEKSPQFWTSFSGNYRNVKDICHQISLPNEKSQILEVYGNVTNLYKAMMRDLTASHRYSASVQDELQEKFEKIFKVMESLLERKVEEEAKLNNSFAKFFQNFESSMSNALVVIGDSYKGIDTDIKIVERHLHYFTAEMEGISFRLQQHASEVSMQQSEMLNKNAHLLDLQDQVLEKVEDTTKELVDLQDLAKTHALVFHRQSQFMEFTLEMISKMLRANVDDLYLQKTLIYQQSSSILEQITNSLVEHVNKTSSKLTENLEDALQGSLARLESRLEQTSTDVLSKFDAASMWGVLSSFSFSSFLSKMMMVLVVLSMVFANLGSICRSCLVLLRWGPILFVSVLLGIYAAMVAIQLLAWLDHYTAPMGE